MTGNGKKSHLLKWRPGGEDIDDFGEILRSKTRSLSIVVTAHTARNFLGRLKNSESDFEKFN
jgi:uncharacterized Fe-S cluster-containing protein